MGRNLSSYVCVMLSYESFHSILCRDWKVLRCVLDLLKHRFKAMWSIQSLFNSCQWTFATDIQTFDVECHENIAGSHASCSAKNQTRQQKDSSCWTYLCFLTSEITMKWNVIHLCSGITWFRCDCLGKIVKTFQLYVRSNSRPTF